MEYHCLICYDVCDPLEPDPDLKSKILNTFCELHNFNPNLFQEIQDSSGVNFCPPCIDELQRARRILESLRIFQKQLENVKADLDRNFRESSINSSKYISLNILRKKIIDQIDLNATGGNNKSAAEEEGFKLPNSVTTQQVAQSVQRSPELDGLKRKLTSLNPLPKPVETPRELVQLHSQVPKPNKLNCPSLELEVGVLTAEELEETEPFQGNSEEQTEESPEAVKLLSPEEKERLRSECLSNRLILCLERLKGGELVDHSNPQDPDLIKKVKRGKPKCNECGRIFRNHYNLKQHLKAFGKVHGVNKKQCPICSKLLSRSRIKDHISAHDESSPKSLCPHCGKSFKHRRNLVDHIKNRHSPEDSISEPIPCPHEGCGKFFKASLNLKLHFKRIHESDSLPLACEICSKKFDAKSQLERHKNSHYGIKPLPKPYNCDTCGGNYANSSELKRHVNQVHLKTHNHFCETCGKGFWSLRFLKSHQNHHTKPFQCSFCPKMFGSVTYVRIHEYSHSEEKDCQCETCGKSFKGPFALNKHIYRTHTRRKSNKGEN